jgi:L-threonylcarbamoyladenylate synthase
MRYSPDIYKHIDAAAEVLRGGGTILYPTDTIWGLGCDAALRYENKIKKKKET